MRTFACVVALWFAAAGCTETDKVTASGLAPPNTVIEPETPLAIYGTRTVGTTPTTGALSATDLENALYSLCYAEVEAALPIFCPNTGNLDVGGCSGHECLMQMNACVANKYMEISEEVRELSFTTQLLGGAYGTYTLPAGTSVTYDIPPQSAANRTLAFDLAVTAFSRSGERAVSSISSTTPNCFTTSGGINSTVTQTDIRNNRAKVFAATYADVMNGLAEASRGFARNSLQVAGFQRQRERDYGEAGQLLWNGRVNSVRSVAAAMGADDDVMSADITLATCVPSLQDKAGLQAAVTLQRHAALSETLGATTTENFLTSLRNEVEDLNPELDFGTMTNDEFLDHFDLTRSDIAGARQYLQEEHAAFQRTNVETYAGSGHVAGIATEPQPLPAGAVLADTAGARVLTAATVSQSAYRASGILQMLDYLRWGARKAFRVSALPSQIQPSMRAAQAIGESETGLRRVTVVSNGATSVRVNVHGVTSIEKFVVAAGLDGARCLSEGTIEGAPCNPASYILDDTATFVAGDPSFVHEMNGTLTYTATVTTGQDLYLLSADGPWKVLAGLNPAGIPGTATALVLPIGGLLQDSMAAAVAPHPGECGETANDCVGLPAEFVVPLESELTEDNDPYENSWRHYLDMADQMAQEADALGEELVEAGLALDMRAEAARDELESLCGPVQNVGTIHDNDLANRDGSVESCLSGGASNARLPWVTLGDRYSCVPTGNSNPQCPDCPDPTGNPPTCPANYELVTPLGLIQSTPAANLADCTLLASLVGANPLEGSARRNRIEELLQQPERWANRRELARLMDQSLFDENADGQLEVSLGGTTILSLSDQSAVPCARPLPPGIPENDAQNAALETLAPELFAQHCSLDDGQRQDYIQVARRTFGTLRLLTGSLAENMRRSWIYPADQCEQDDVLTTFGDCGRYNGAWPCDTVGGCRCRWDSPAQPWHYGNVPCSQDLARVDVVPRGEGQGRGSDWVDLWSAEGGIDCVQDGERSSLEMALCQTPRGARFGYPWEEIASLGQHPSIGEPLDPLSPTADEANSYVDADTVTDFDVYRALAFACYMQLDSSAGCPAFDPANPTPAPTVDSPGDLKLVEDRIACAASAVRSAAGHVLLANVPEVIVNALGSGDIQSLYPSFRGEQLDALVAIQTDLAQLGEHAVSLETQLLVARQQTDHVRNQLKEVQLQGQIQELQTLSRLLTIAADAAASAFVSFSASTAFTVPQFVLTEEISQLEQEVLELHAADVLTDYSTQVATTLGEIHRIGTDLHTAVYRLNADLGRLETIQRRASSLAAQVSFQDEDDLTGKLFPVTTVMRRRYNTLRVRYERARDRARQMGFIARRAIEQRFGLNLSQMNEDLTLVEAPARWARDVCTFEGIDYDRIREAPPAGVEVPDNYVDGYLGEYVEKLRLFVETYPFDFPFQDGSDLAVISMRDDILRAKSLCEVPVPNLLAASDSVLGLVDETGESVAAWTVQGCADPNESCLFLETRADLVVPGRQANRIADAPVDMADTTGVLVQEVEVPRAGRFLLSWRDRFVGAPQGGRDLGVPDDQRTYRVTLERVGSAEVATEVADPAGAPASRDLELDTTDGGVLRVTIDPCQTATTRGDVWIAELQLEELGPEMPATASEYVATTTAGMARLAVCPDFDGAVFRDRFFGHRCERLCSGGVEEGCGDRGERVQSDRCFWETEFGIGLEQIERGDLIPSGAIALGNYNYRHDLVAANLVGTNVRDCTQSDEPATCYSNAYIPISLIHAGETRIRNHTGDDVAFDFGRGLIEHGKGLASEVVLTNPISGSAETLLQPYYKEELRGRPLTGQYWLRVWDDPALNWDNVEDIQLVFRYRYWTRFGE